MGEILTLNDGFSPSLAIYLVVIILIDSEFYFEELIPR